MSALKQLFTEHPKEAGMTYGEHFRGALSFGTRLLRAGVMAIVHSILPFLFKTSAGDEIERLYARLMQVRKRKALD